MKNVTQGLHKILLVAAMGMPLMSTGAMAHAATADEGVAAPMQGDADGGPGPDGPEHGPHRRGGPGFGPRMGGGMPPFGIPGAGFEGAPPMLRGVELSEAQQDKVFAVLYAEQPYLREQAKAAGKAHEALRALARADKYDDAKAATLAQAAGSAMANIALQRVRTEQKLLAILTPEQRKQQADERKDNDEPRRPRP